MVSAIIELNRRKIAENVAVSTVITANTPWYVDILLLTLTVNLTAAIRSVAYKCHSKKRTHTHLQRNTYAMYMFLEIINA